jgi:hypothetical protein
MCTFLILKTTANIILKEYSLKYLEIYMINIIPYKPKTNKITL